MSQISTNNLFNGFSTLSGGTSNGTYPPYISHPSRYYTLLFTELVSMFDLKNIEEHQLKLLNELYDSGDESNRKIAVELFKYLMKEDKKKVDAQ